MIVLEFVFEIEVEIGFIKIKDNNYYIFIAVLYMIMKKEQGIFQPCSYNQYIII
jgi:hypothetical protein